MDAAASATAGALELNGKPDYEKRRALRGTELLNGEYCSHAL